MWQALFCGYNGNQRHDIERTRASFDGPIQREGTTGDPFEFRCCNPPEPAEEVTRDFTISEDAVSHGIHAAPESSESYQKSRALVIGLDYNYAKYGSDEKDIPALSGGVCDAERVRQVLIDHYKFKSTDIRILTDRPTHCNAVPFPATRANMLEGLQWLVEGIKKGDTLVFFFAGHTSIADLLPHERPQWLAQDDPLVAFCVGEELIFMYEFWAKTNALPSGCSMVCLVDASHGQAVLNVPYVLPKEESRAPNMARVNPRHGVRYLPPRRTPAWWSPRHIPSIALGLLPKGVNGFVLCACGRNDVARELFPSSSNSNPGGLFTVALCEVMTMYKDHTVTVMQLYETLKLKMLHIAQTVPAATTGGLPQHQCPSLAYNPYCPPENTAFIMPPRSDGIADVSLLSNKQQPLLGSGAQALAEIPQLFGAPPSLASGPVFKPVLASNVGSMPVLRAQSVPHSISPCVAPVLQRPVVLAHSKPTAVAVRTTLQTGVSNTPLLATRSTPVLPVREVATSRRPSQEPMSSRGPVTPMQEATAHEQDHQVLIKPVPSPRVVQDASSKTTNQKNDSLSSTTALVTCIPSLEHSQNDLSNGVKGADPKKRFDGATTANYAIHHNSDLDSNSNATMEQDTQSTIHTGGLGERRVSNAMSDFGLPIDSIGNNGASSSEAPELQDIRRKAKRFYKQQSLQAHPDKGGSTEQFQQLNKDYNLVTRHLNRRDAVEPNLKRPLSDPG